MIDLINTTISFTPALKREDIERSHRLGPKVDRKKAELLDAVRKIVESDKRKTPFHDNRPGETRYRNFMRRHPEIAIREPENVTAVRACVTEGAIRGWFQKARSYLSSHEGSAFEQIMADPRRIFNTDETSFSLCPKSGKVLGPKGRRNV